jgi:hypothetical protein
VEEVEEIMAQVQHHQEDLEEVDRVETKVDQYKLQQVQLILEEVVEDKAIGIHLQELLKVSENLEVQV